MSDLPARPAAPSRARIVAAVGLLAVGGAAWALWPRETLRADPDSHLISLEKRGIRYEFHPVSGVESLWDVTLPAADRRNLIRDRPEEARALRERLLERVGVPDLKTLRERHRETIESLRKLGYF